MGSTARRRGIGDNEGVVWDKEGREEFEERLRRVERRGGYNR